MICGTRRDSRSFYLARKLSERRPEDDNSFRIRFIVCVQLVSASL